MSARKFWARCERTSAAAQPNVKTGADCFETIHVITDAEKIADAIADIEDMLRNHALPHHRVREIRELEKGDIR